jgi:hypothetical protein
MQKILSVNEIIILKELMDFVEILADRSQRYPPFAIPRVKQIQ